MQLWVQGSTNLHRETDFQQAIRKGIKNQPKQLLLVTSKEKIFPQIYAKDKKLYGLLPVEKGLIQTLLVNVLKYFF